MKKCPKCGSKQVAPILYGLPVFDDEMEQKLRNQELYLGGCCVSANDPQFHCFGCGKDVGTKPILVSKHGDEDYRAIVASIRYSDGGFHSGYNELLIKKTHSGIIADARLDFKNAGAPVRKTVSNSEWTKLLDKLYCKLYLHEWKKRFNNWSILDGEQWELEIRLAGNRVRSYSGSNAFPPYWKELKQLFQPYFKSEF